MDKKDEMQEPENKNEGAGRTSNTGKDVKQDNLVSYDISEVDKQEGEMNHGEKGGNFNEENSPGNSNT
jgi:hypothetical protein